MKLVLVDDNIHFRDDLKFFIEHKLYHNVIAVTVNKEELLTLSNLEEADIILVDLTIEDIDGCYIVKPILSKHPKLKILAMTMDSGLSLLLKMKENGFNGYIIKTKIFRSLETVLQSVYSGEFAFPEKIKNEIPQSIGKLEADCMGSDVFTN